jgi:SSS family solute:Na+ symporter
VVALCFFLPMYLPERYRTRRLFPAVVAALALHHVLLWHFPLPAEMTMLPSLLLELTFVLAGPERTEA